MGFESLNFGFGGGGSGGGGGTVTGTGTDNHVVLWDGTGVPAIKDSDFIRTASEHLVPETTAIQDLGEGARRWRDLYLGSVINYASNLTFSENGTDSMYIDAGGDVAIGTNFTTPQGKVHIQTASAGVISPSTLGDDLIIENTLATGVSIFTNDTGTANLYYGTPTDGEAMRVFYIATNDSWLATLNSATWGSLILDGTGVSVGIAVGDTLFNVIEDDSIGTPLISADTIATFLNTATAGTNLAASLISGNTGSASLFFGDNNLENPGRVTYSNATNSMSFFTSSTFGVIIDGSQNVGIGVVSPTFNLDVLADTNIGDTSGYYIGGELVLESTAGFGTTVKSRGTGGTTDRVLFEALGGNRMGEFREGIALIDVPDATAVSTLQDSNLLFSGKFWNGVASENFDTTIVYNMLSTIPTSQIEFRIGGGSSDFTLRENGRAAINTDSSVDSHLVIAGDGTTPLWRFNTLGTNSFIGNANGTIQARANGLSTSSFGKMWETRKVGVSPQFNMYHFDDSTTLDISDSAAHGLLITNDSTTDDNFSYVGFTRFTSTTSVVSIGARIDQTNTTGDFVVLIRPSGGGTLNPFIIDRTGNSGFGSSLTSPNSGLQVDTTFAWKHVSSSVDDTSTDETIIGIDDTTVARTVTLQTADVVAGRIVIVKDESGAAGTNNITVDTQGAELIDGVASVSITANYGVIRVYSDGTNWFTI